MTTSLPQGTIFIKTNMSTHLATTHTLFRAFADETRLRIVNPLLEGEICVCHLCRALDVSQPSISRHLAYLARVDLVAVRQEGKWKYYAAKKQPTGLHRTLLNCVRTCLRDFEVLQEDLAKLRRLQRDDRCC